MKLKKKSFSTFSSPKLPKFSKKCRTNRIVIFAQKQCLKSYTNRNTEEKAAERWKLPKDSYETLKTAFNWSAIENDCNGQKWKLLVSEDSDELIYLSRKILIENKSFFSFF